MMMQSSFRIWKRTFPDNDHVMILCRSREEKESDNLKEGNIRKGKISKRKKDQPRRRWLVFCMFFVWQLPKLPNRVFFSVHQPEGSECSSPSINWRDRSVLLRPSTGGIGGQKNSLHLGRNNATEKKELAKTIRNDGKESKATPRIA